MLNRIQTLRYIVAVLCLWGLAGCVAVATRDVEKTGRTAGELIFPPAPDPPRFVFERAIRASVDIVPEEESSALKRALTGVGTETGAAMNKPYAIAVHQGKIYVSDSASRTVHLFDVPNHKYSTVGDATGEGQILKPLGLDTDAQGNLYIADGTLKLVIVFDAKGNFLRKIGKPADFDRLSSVTVDPKGERLYVVDIGGVNSSRHQVRVFDAVNGNQLFDIGRRGAGPGEFNLPRDVAIGKDGRIYVVDGGNFRVQVFDRDGKYLSSFGEVGKQLGNFARPKEIAVDPEGNVYVADSAFGNFQIFSSEGQLLMYIGERGSVDAPALYMLPSGIAVDEDGRIYFVDQWFKRIDIYRPHALKATEGYLGKRLSPVAVKRAATEK